MVHFRVDDSVGDDDARDVWAVYEPVFGDQPSYQTWRDSVWDRHSTRDGFPLARAYDDELVGFAYGYTGLSGQWWTDNARQALSRDAAETWLGGHFELVSIGVLASARHSGIGRALMHALLDDLPHERLLLMTTAKSSDPARRLYTSEGWQVIGPGIGDGTVIMGKRSEGTRDARLL